MEHELQAGNAYRRWCIDYIVALSPLHLDLKFHSASRDMTPEAQFGQPHEPMGMQWFYLAGDSRPPALMKYNLHVRVSWPMDVTFDEFATEEKALIEQLTTHLSTWNVRIESREECRQRDA